MGAVLFVRGKLPTSATVEYAMGTGIPLLATRRIMFETCGILYKAGLHAAQRKQMPLDHAPRTPLVLRRIYPVAPVTWSRPVRCPPRSAASSSPWG